MSVQTVCDYQPPHRAAAAEHHGVAADDAAASISISSNNNNSSGGGGMHSTSSSSSVSHLNVLSPMPPLSISCAPPFFPHLALSSSASQPHLSRKSKALLHLQQQQQNQQQQQQQLAHHKSPPPQPHMISPPKHDSSHPTSRRHRAAAAQALEAMLRSLHLSGDAPLPNSSNNLQSSSTSSTECALSSNTSFATLPPDFALSSSSSLASLPPAHHDDVINYERADSDDVAAANHASSSSSSSAALTSSTSTSTSTSSSHATTSSTSLLSQQEKLVLAYSYGLRPPHATLASSSSSSSLLGIKKKQRNPSLSSSVSFDSVASSSSSSHALVPGGHTHNKSAKHSRANSLQLRMQQLHNHESNHKIAQYYHILQRATRNVEHVMNEIDPVQHTAESMAELWRKQGITEQEITIRLASRHIAPTSDEQTKQAFQHMQQLLQQLSFHPSHSNQHHHDDDEEDDDNYQHSENESDDEKTEKHNDDGNVKDKQVTIQEKTSSNQDSLLYSDSPLPGDSSSERASPLDNTDEKQQHSLNIDEQAVSSTHLLMEINDYFLAKRKLEMNELKRLQILENKQNEMLEDMEDSRHVIDTSIKFRQHHTNELLHRFHDNLRQITIHLGGTHFFTISVPDTSTDHKQSPPTNANTAPPSSAATSSPSDATTTSTDESTKATTTDAASRPAELTVPASSSEDIVTLDSPKPHQTAVVAAPPPRDDPENFQPGEESNKMRLELCIALMQCRLTQATQLLNFIQQHEISSDSSPSEQLAPFYASNNSFSHGWLDKAKPLDALLRSIEALLAQWQQNNYALAQTQANTKDQIAALLNEQTNSKASEIEAQKEEARKKHEAELEQLKISVAESERNLKEVLDKQQRYLNHIKQLEFDVDSARASHEADQARQAETAKQHVKDLVAILQGNQPRHERMKKKRREARQHDDDIDASNSFMTHDDDSSIALLNDPFENVIDEPIDVPPLPINHESDDDELPPLALPAAFMHNHHHMSIDSTYQEPERTSSPLSYHLQRIDKNMELLDSLHRPQSSAASTAASTTLSSSSTSTASTSVSTSSAPPSAESSDARGWSVLEQHELKRTAQELIHQIRMIKTEIEAKKRDQAKYTKELEAKNAEIKKTNRAAASNKSSKAKALQRENSKTKPSVDKKEKKPTAAPKPQPLPKAPPPLKLTKASSQPLKHSRSSESIPVAASSAHDPASASSSTSHNVRASPPLVHSASAVSFSSLSHLHRLAVSNNQDLRAQIQELTTHNTRFEKEMQTCMKAWGHLAKIQEKNKIAESTTIPTYNKRIKYVTETLNELQQLVDKRKQYLQKQADAAAAAEAAAAQAAASSAQDDDNKLIPGTRGRSHHRSHSSLRASSTEKSTGSGHSRSHSLSRSPSISRSHSRHHSRSPSIDLGVAGSAAVILSRASSSRTSPITSVLAAAAPGTSLPLTHQHHQQQQHPQHHQRTHSNSNASAHNDAQQQHEEHEQHRDESPHLMRIQNKLIQDPSHRSESPPRDRSCSPSSLSHFAPHVFRSNTSELNVVARQLRPLGLSSHATQAMHHHKKHQAHSRSQSQSHDEHHDKHDVEHEHHDDSKPSHDEHEATPSTLTLAVDLQTN